MTINSIQKSFKLVLSGLVSELSGFSLGLSDSPLELSDQRPLPALHHADSPSSRIHRFRRGNHET